MPWPVVTRSNLRRLSTVVFGLALLFVSVIGSSASAVDTEIGAKICGDTPAGAVVRITQPNDDSVISQPVMTIRGAIERASQVTIEIDDAYNNTLAVASSQTVFSSDITLTEGTHTITVTANEICGGSDGVDSVVVTYQPASQPSSGEVTPTAVEATQDESGVVFTDDQIVQDETAAAIDQVPSRGSIFNLVPDFAYAIGLTQTVSGGNIPLVTGVARVGLTVVAATSVVMASSLAPAAVRAVPGVSEVFHIGSHRSLIYLEWAIRGVGVLALAIAYFL